MCEDYGRMDDIFANVTYMLCRFCDFFKYANRIRPLLWNSSARSRRILELSVCVMVAPMLQSRHADVAENRQAPNYQRQYQL